MKRVAEVEGVRASIVAFARDAEAAGSQAETQADEIDTLETELQFLKSTASTLRASTMSLPAQNPFAVLPRLQEADLHRLVAAMVKKNKQMAAEHANQMHQFVQTSNRIAKQEEEVKKAENTIADLTKV